MISVAGYTAISPLHEGWRTLVLRGRRDDDGAPVVLKVLRREHPPLRDVARLRHEFAVLQRLDDPGIVRALDFVERGPRVALILEDFGGASLRPQIPVNGFELADFLAIAAALARSLAAVHRAGVLHKDIKPDNIIVLPDLSRLALADFSIASVLREERSAAAAPELLEGSLAYLSPEQTGRMNRPVDQRSDFYALGITFYELLTGTLPFRAAEPLEMVHAHIARRPIPVDAVREDVPAIVAAIVARLLEKNAEDRYQSAAGLLADLERVDADHRAGRVVDFPLGARDRSERFALTTALFGRDEEARLVLGAFERACAGGNELVLLAGPGGIGKSALVREIQRPMVRERGSFIAGKFDAIDRGAPYSALALALRELTLQILGEPAERLDGWRRAVLGALGPNTRLVVEMIPELERLVGPQPPVAAMPATEAANRFHGALRLLVGVFAREDHPLAIFLDDLHWGDLATFKLIEDLVGDPGLGHVLWIGTYRDAEVSPEHPLERMCEALTRAGASVSRRALAPLAEGDVRRMVAATLHADPEEVTPLAALVHARSDGNPFFVRVILQTLHDQGVLAFDAARGAWGWDLAAVEAASLPDDVAELVTRRIVDLGAPTQALLRTAAGIGGRFELHLLARLAEVAPLVALERLWEAVRAGLVRPVGDDYKFVRDEARAVEFEFVHDRVQTAAHALLSADERVRIHLAVGRLMLEGAGPEPGDAALFAIAGHFKEAAALVVDVGERRRVAAVMLRAGRRAKMSTAYHAACDLLEAGVGLLPADPWPDEPALIAALQRERIECEYLAGRPERAIALFAPLLARTPAARDKADLHALRAVLETNRGDLAAAIAAGREGLALFDHRLPGKATAASVLRAFARFQLLRGRAPVSSILELPRLTDADRLAELRVLMAMAAAAYFVDTNLASVILLRIANLSLKHGLSEVSAYGLIGAGLVMSGAFGRYEAGEALGRVARQLNERLENAELAAKIILFYATFMMVWTRPFDEVKRALREAAEVGLGHGDIIYAVYSAVTEVFVMVIDGSPLDYLDERLHGLMPLLRRRRLDDQIATITYMIHVFGRALRDPEGRDEGFDEAAFRAGIDDARTPLVMFYYHLYRAMHRHLLGDDEAAAAALEEAVARTKVAFGSAIIADLRFYECLILARGAPRRRGGARRAIDARIQRGLKELGRWARSAPANYGAREALVRGEWARLRGDDGEALRRYNEAIALAREHHAPHLEGLAAECALRFACDRDFPILARAYLAEALAAYRSWGALARVSALARDFSAHLVEPPTATLERGTASAATMTRATSTIALDLDTVIKAARTISGELEMDRLLERLAILLVENAGARRGVLLLDVDGALRVEAEARCEADGVRVEVGLGVPADRHPALPHSIINLVVRTHEDVILADAARDPLHGVDPFVRDRRVRSLLCTPILHQGALACVLYLENDLTAGAFTHRRLALIRQLAAQMAVSLTNARLYASLDEARAAALAADRAKTRFLMNMSHELRTPLNAILGYTELIAENAAAGDLRTLDDDLRAVHRAGVRLLRSVSSILELTRLETDARVAHPVVVDLGALLPGLCAAFEDAAAVRGNTLRIEGPSPLPRLTTDEHMLRYALTTLLDNAARFTEGGEIVVRVAELRREGAPWIEIAVVDSGIGIDPAAAPGLFDAFSQADDSTTRRFDGTGVSLAVAARFCQRLGGEITAAGAPSKGSVFTIRLPLDRSQDPGAADA